MAEFFSKKFFNENVATLEPAADKPEVVKSDIAPQKSPAHAALYA
jgi:hypothetical protein